MITTHYFYNTIPVQYEASTEERNQILAQYPGPELPNEQETFNILDEAPGNAVQCRVLLNDFSVQLTKTGKQYLKIRFSNNNGLIQAKMWDNQGAVNRHTPDLETYAIFDIEGTVDEFRGHKTITVHSLTPSNDTVLPFHLLPYTKQNIEDLTVELVTYLQELNSPYKEICLTALNRFWDQFRIRPAAMFHHHDYLGGLLKHTVGLMRFARYILMQEDNPFQAIIKLINVVEKAYKKELWETFQANDTNHRLVWKDTIDHLYTMLRGAMQYHEHEANRDILMTSIFFHDMGKLLEYDHAGKTFDELEFLFPTANMEQTKTQKQAGITVDPLGGMIGHIPYGVLLLTKVIETENIAVTIEAIHQMTHCILCHHGLPEWGSCVRDPQTLEGYIIHIVDYLDSRYENSEPIK